MQFQIGCKLNSRKIALNSRKIIGQGMALRDNKQQGNLNKIIVKKLAQEAKKLTIT